ncbi:hypothetical protein BCON_0037g00180 [Botryotinia convoluta]|uniref:Uncharacterized protein n=1 Tax=Botryotinia convoluta TaxID=54673 RepID=A0A4Z1IFG5_9HELO|nr:hypothetical protein BCON_0037g00180 [Botryotinia convoluta]
MSSWYHTKDGVELMSVGRTSLFQMSFFAYRPVAAIPEMIMIWNDCLLVGAGGRFLHSCLVYTVIVEAEKGSEGSDTYYVVASNLREFNLRLTGPNSKQIYTAKILRATRDSKALSQVLITRGKSLKVEFSKM